MKLIIAFIRTEQLAAVKSSLFHEGITGMSISTVLGHGGELNTVEHYRGSAVVFEFVEKVRIEIAVSDSFVERTINLILESARTGDVGDGKIIIQPIERVIRIRTGEEDTLAVTPLPTSASSSSEHKA